MNENKLKHLEFIQNIITRMNSNSFMIKGWSVTLVSALFALAADKANPTFVLIAYLPVLVFWGLDGFFLSQEKQYRKLHVEVAGKTEDQIDFNLNASKYEGEVGGWLRCAWTKTLAPFHGTILLTVILVSFFLFLKMALQLLGGVAD